MKYKEALELWQETKQEQLEQTEGTDEQRSSAASLSALQKLGAVTRLASRAILIGMWENFQSGEWKLCQDGKYPTYREWADNEVAPHLSSDWRKDLVRIVERIFAYVATHKVVVPATGEFVSIELLIEQGPSMLKVVSPLVEEALDDTEREKHIVETALASDVDSLETYRDQVRHARLPIKLHWTYVERGDGKADVVMPGLDKNAQVLWEMIIARRGEFIFDQAGTQTA